MSEMHDIDKNVFFQLVQPPKSAFATGIVPATYIDVNGYDYFAFIYAVGAGFDRTTYAGQVVQATAGAGTGSKNVTGALTTLPSAANKMVAVVCRVAALDTNNSFRYVALSHTSAGGAADLATVWFLAWRGRSLPITQADLESIVRV
jgi:hypothetical protein